MRIQGQEAEPNRMELQKLDLVPGREARRGEGPRLDFVYQGRRKWRYPSIRPQGGLEGTRLSGLLWTGRGGSGEGGFGSTIDEFDSYRSKEDQRTHPCRDDFGVEELPFPMFFFFVFFMCLAEHGHTQYWSSEYDPEAWRGVAWLDVEWRGVAGRGGAWRDDSRC